MLGGVEVPVGAYYAVLEHTKQHGVRMVLLDPTAIRKRRLDAYEAAKTKGGLAIPLSNVKGKGFASQLSLELTVDRSKRDRGVLRPYARENPAEFFACATEAFFEQPSMLRRRAPDLFAELERFYGWCPPQQK